MEKQFIVQTKGVCKECDGRAVLNRMNIHVTGGEILVYSVQTEQERPHF